MYRHPSIPRYPTHPSLQASHSLIPAGVCLPPFPVSEEELAIARKEVARLDALEARRRAPKPAVTEDPGEPVEPTVAPLAKTEHLRERIRKARLDPTISMQAAAEDERRRTAVSEGLLEWRWEAKLTQKEVAARAQRSVAWVRRLETPFARFTLEDVALYLAAVGRRLVVTSVVDTEPVPAFKPPESP